MKIGLIGADIGASKTPAMHMAEAKAQGFALEYNLLDLSIMERSAQDLPQILREVEHLGYAGVNVTHPCKQSVIAHLDWLSPDASALGAVNTVVFKDNQRFGYNTDWTGFAASFERSFHKVAKTNVLLLGAGGAGTAVAYAAWKLGFGKLFIHDVDQNRAQTLADRLNQLCQSDFAEVVRDIAFVMGQADGLINTTPMGMARYPGMAIDPKLLRAEQWVADVVYFPLETDLLKAAKAQGCQILNGGGMAVFQAVAAFELFTGRKAEPERMIRHFMDLIS